MAEAGNLGESGASRRDKGNRKLPTIMNRPIKILFLFAFSCFFLLLFSRASQWLPGTLYEALKWCCIALFLVTLAALLVDLVRYLRRRDWRGALGTVTTILVFGILILLLTAYMSVSP